VSKNPYAGPDARTRAAKARGYPARSVFKLEEIDRRVRLLKAGQRVLDLGAAPGSWSLYAAERVGARGKVLAIDRSEILQVFPAQVTVVQGDALELGTAELAAFAPYDVVLSDMAPNTSGSKAADQARSFELFTRAVAVARELGAPGSAFVGKLFMSGDFGAARSDLLASFARCQVIKPEGTRSRSSEVFLIGLEKR
jgi:23S rRNA (uridine2552-2'-O)-methyltransferase